MALEYLELEDGSKEVPDNVLAVMLRLRHPANPDFITQYASVVRWYAEVNIESRNVVREIGLNAEGEPVVLGPFGRNDGVWAGLSFGVDVVRSRRVDRQEFEAAWEKLTNQYRDRVPPKKTAPRLLVTTQEQLLGLWSVNILHGPGSMSDQLIAFLPDGRGFFEIVNCTTCSYDSFRWRIVGQGVIAITGETHYYLEETCQVAQAPSDFDYPALRADVQTHYSGDGSSIEVLYLPLREFSGVFGRREIPPTDIQFPSFTMPPSSLFTDE